MPSIINATTTAGVAITGDNSGNLAIQTNNGNTAVTIDTSQNVGIGTTSPSSYNSFGNQLVVGGTGDKGLTIASGTTNYGSIHFADGTSGADSYRGQIVYFHTNNYMSFSTDATERMRISSAGYVTTPFQPAFLVGTTQNDFTINSNAIFPFDVASINVGSNYNTSTYKFTAPVAGLYQVMWMCFYTDSGGATNIMNTAPYKNDAQILIADDAIMGCAKPSDAGGQICVGGTAIVSLAANDTLSLYARGSNVRIYGGHSFFSGYLIG